jgi:hypothetical protein
MISRSINTNHFSRGDIWILVPISINRDRHGNTLDIQVIRVQHFHQPLLDVSPPDRLEGKLFGEETAKKLADPN